MWHQPELPAVLWSDSFKNIALLLKDQEIRISIKTYLLIWETLIKRRKKIVKVKPKIQLMLRN